MPTTFPEVFTRVQQLVADSRANEKFQDFQTGYCHGLGRQIDALVDVDSNRKIWNRCVAGELQEMAGFEKCLQLTLYRPRDVLSLLNEAFQQARRHHRGTLIAADVEATAREISETRLDDLMKEYAAVMPSLKPITAAFHGANPELSLQ